MSENTARQYFKRGGELLVNKERDYRTRRDPFVAVGDQLLRLSRDEGLEAKRRDAMANGK